MRNESKNSMKVRAWFFIKLALAFTLLYYLYQQGHLTLESFHVFSDYPMISLSVSAIFLINILLSSVRWQWLLSALKTDMNFKTILDINMIGAFGSVFLLGSVGGDAMRAYYASNQMPHMKTKVLLSLIIDRIIGLVALLILAGAAAVWYYTKLHNGGGSDEFVRIIFVLLLLCAIGAVGVIFLANRFHIRARLARYKQDSRIIHFIVQTLDVIVIFKEKFWVITACLMASLFMQLGSLWSLAILGKVMAIGGLSSLEYMTASSFSLLANSIPLTPGGIGIGESAFSYFCKLLSSDKGITGYSSIFFSYRIIISLVSLIGLWRFIVYKCRIPKDTVTAEQPI